MVITGKDAGKKGKVTQVFPRDQRIVVEGVNTMTKNIRSRKQGEPGQRVQFNAPIHISNVMFIDPSDGKPTRLGADRSGAKKLRRSIRRKATLT